VREAFKAAGYLVHFNSFAAKSKALIPNEVLANINLPPTAFKWAEQARTNILDSKQQNRWVWKDWLRMSALLVATPSKWPSYAKLVGQGNFLSRRMSKQLK